MALLDIFKPSSKESGEAIAFEPMVIMSENNLLGDIEKLALEYNLEPRELDFQILSYKTLFKMQDSPKYHEIGTNEHEKFFTPENLANPALEIKQKLKAEIFKKQDSQPFVFKMSMGGNRSLTKIILRIPAQDNVTFTDHLLPDLLKEIDTRKAKLGLLLGFIDKRMKVGLKELITDIRTNAKISKDYEIVVCEGILPRTQTNGEIILHYLNKDKDENGEKTDNKEYMHAVSKEDLVFEVHQPKEGRVGRNCKGEVIPFDKVEQSVPLDIKVSEDFIIKERLGVSYYYASKDGFIYQDGNSFEIRDELVVDEVSFRSTGSIDAKEQSNIKVNIESKDSLKDSIGQGVCIESSEVKTNGNVGSGAEVYADVVEIGGQTHQSSKIVAHQRADINLHKGYFEGNEVHVKILESGKINATTVYVDKVSGGEIIGKEVYIKDVLSNVVVYASDYIEIENLNGSGNKFIIDPKAQKDFKDKVESVKSSIEVMKDKIKTATKRIKQLRNKLQNDKANIDEVNKTIKDLQQRGVGIPAALVNKVKENQKKIKEHNLLLKELKDDKIVLETLESDLKDLVNSVFEAKIVNKSVWKEFNEILFKVVEPEVEVSHLFTNGELAEEITLQALDDGKFHVKRK